jgi:protein-tyrosine phosphatase
MTRIWERLYIGGVADAEALADGNPEGIDTVVTLCNLGVQARQRDINYLHFQLEDGLPIPVGRFDAIIDAVAENIRWGRILLHSSDGMSRAPGIAAAWMDVVGFKNIDAALAEIRQFCPNISPSDIVVESLRRHLR